MPTNKLVWVLVAFVLIACVVAFINSNQEPSEPRTAQQAQNVDPNYRADVKAVDGDTAADTLRNVDAKYDTMDERYKALATEFENLSAQVQQNAEASGSGDPQKNRVGILETQLNTATSTIDMLKEMVTSQQNTMNTTRANGYEFNASDLGWGTGVDEYSTGSGNTRRTSNRQNEDIVEPTVQRLPGYVSVVPLTTKTRQDKLSALSDIKNVVDGIELPANGLASKSGLASKANRATNGLIEDEVTPYFTIPARATLLRAKAMTALIGRVPVGGRVQDPFPVKIILNRENLATNGYKIPGLKGIVFEGLAKGNWVLGCVSVDLTGATYTFNDGRIQHLEPTGAGQAEGQQQGSPITGGGSGGTSASLGYVSDTQGSPCIVGKRISDAPRQLATMGLLGAAKSYFEAKANAETTRITALDTGISGSQVTGDELAFANNQTAANTVGTVMDFYQERNRDTFDVIVTPPGETLNLHINQDLLIDYHTAARKLVYSQGDEYGSNTSLD